MRIVHSLEELEKPVIRPVVTIGNFDGVHLGHQQIIAAAKEAARSHKTIAVAMTFEPHPAAVLHPEDKPGVLTPLVLKAELLRQGGLDSLIVIKDNPRLLQLSPDEFVDQFLMKKLQPVVVVEGEDFNFGRHRAGSVLTLQQFAGKYGFEVRVVPMRQVRLSGKPHSPVSSSAIRRLLTDGRVSDARAHLGRPYRLIGTVTPGYGRGAALGFPTANIEPSEQIIPAHGVYAGLVAVGGACEQVCATESRTPAVFSIGGGQTFNAQHPLLVEAHLLTENVPPLYDKWLAMDFVRHIRSQQKFESEKQLSEQIAKDCQKAKQILLEKA